MPRAKNILLVTPNFPPFAMAGAARMGALARYWAAQGINVYVLAASNNTAHGLHKALDNERVYAEFLPIAEIAPILQVHKSSTPVSPSTPTVQKKPSAFRRLIWALRALPDRYHPRWTGRATMRGRVLAAAHKIDYIYSSGPPHSVHIAAANIKRATGLPWICEQRDLWINNPFDKRGWPAEFLNAKLARRALPLANAFVGVTQGAVAQLQGKHKVPAILAYNGLDPKEFDNDDMAQKPSALDPHKLTILHPGVIYAEKRDPGPLFAAMALLNDNVRRSIRVIFFHDEYDYVMDLAKKHGVTEQLEFHDMIPRDEVLALERQADLLLLAHWDDPRADAVIPGKVFEYIGARRPIIATGSANSEVAQIVRKGGFGLSGAAPKDIAAQLKKWLEKKRAAGGRIPDLPAAPVGDFTRDRQFAKIDALAKDMLAGNLTRRATA